MAWANPDNIKTNNVDANTDSPTLARADIKTAFDELRNVANNSKLTYTPSFTASQGTVTITYTAQEGCYIPMGGMTYLDVFIHANILYSDAPGSIAQLTMNLPVAPSISNSYQTGNSFKILLADGVPTSHWPTGLNWDEDIKFFGKTTASSTDLEFRYVTLPGSSQGITAGTDIDIPLIPNFNGNINSGDGTMALKVQGFYFT